MALGQRLASVAGTDWKVWTLNGRVDTAIRTSFARDTKVLFPFPWEHCAIQDTQPQEREAREVSLKDCETSQGWKKALGASDRVTLLQGEVS